MKSSFIVSFVALSIVGLIASTGCGAAFNPCGVGEKQCSDGTCAPENNSCCGGGVSCPPNAPICGPGVCYGVGGGGGGGGGVSGCLASGEETCNNSDGVSDCAPLGSACCGNHHWCPLGHTCINGGNACSP
jgi:hypothetical protein